MYRYFAIFTMLFLTQAMFYYHFFKTFYHNFFRFRLITSRIRIDSRSDSGKMTLIYADPDPEHWL
jgi:hypothetical protein